MLLLAPQFGRSSFSPSKTTWVSASKVVMLFLGVIASGTQGSAAQIPTVSVDPATQVGSTSAMISGSINPNGLATGFWVRFGTNTEYGRWTATAPIQAQDTPVSVTREMTDLAPNTTYHYQLVATNGAGNGYSADMTLTTTESPPPNPQTPAVTVDAASQVTSTGATITGTVNPHGLLTAFYVQWGTTTAYGNSGPVMPVLTQDAPVEVSTTMTGLNPNTTYHYQLVATNGAGNGYSVDMTLKTLDGQPPTPTPPTVATGPATEVTFNSAIIAGTVSLSGAATTYYFRWGTNTAYGNALSAVTTPANQYGEVQALGSLTGLSSGTTYHYQLVATNSAGTGYGADQTFTTLFDFSTQDFTYATNNGAITITRYIGPGGNVVIPSTIDGLPVTAIGNGAFWSLGAPIGVTGVTIPDSVTRIGDSAFQGCANLTSVTIPDSVTDLGEAAFASCSSLTNITIGSGITTIKGGANGGNYGTFQWCTSLTRVTIPDTVTNISNGPIHLGGALGAFYGCVNLTDVIVGKGLTYLGAGAFNYCAKLAGVYFNGNAPTPGQDYFGVDIFHDSDFATIYYVPGTTGWEATYAGRPTAPWIAQPQTGDGSLGVRQSGFGFNVAGPAGIPFIVEASTNPAAAVWDPVKSFMPTNGAAYFSDPDWAQYPRRFYRIRAQ